MKVALVHDYIKEYGGAERVLEAFHDLWPEAPVYTTVYLPEFLGPHRKRFDGWDIRTSKLQHVWGAGKLISPFRVLSPWYFDNIDFRGYDLIITSATGAYFPNLILRQPEGFHICYCHTPPRYLYGYPTARNWSKNSLGKGLALLINHELRKWDYVSYQRPDAIIANSHEVQKRIEKFYRRDATVIYPPVDLIDRMNSKSSRKTQKLSAKTGVNDYFITGGRLARSKHIDLIIEVCNKMKLPLKIFGRSFAGYGEELQRIAGPTVEFMGEVGDQKLIELYRGAKALLYASEYEDFGIIPVEAQGCGIPVIGPYQGGVKETMIADKTGVFFHRFEVGSIVMALNKFNTLKIKPEDCMANARRFSNERFKKEIKNFVSSKLRSQIH